MRISYPSVQASGSSSLGNQIPCKRTTIPHCVVSLSQHLTVGDRLGSGDMGTFLPYLLGRRRRQGYGVEVVAHLCWMCSGGFVWVESFEVFWWKHFLLAPCLHCQVAGFFYLHFTRSVGLAAMLYKKKMFPVENRSYVQKHVWFLNSESLFSIRKKVGVFGCVFFFFLVPLI